MPFVVDTVTTCSELINMRSPNGTDAAVVVNTVDDILIVTTVRTTTIVVNDIFLKILSSP
jgi:hypothetical protein